MTVAGPQGEIEEPAARKRRRRRQREAVPCSPAVRALRGCGRAATLTFFSLLAFVIAAAVLCWTWMMQAPVALPSWVAHQVEAQINHDLTAGRITLDRVEVAVGSDGRPQVRIRNVGIYDDRGTEVAQLNEVGAAFELRKLVRGDVVPEALSLSGAQMTIRRRTDGAFDLRFGSGAGTTGNVASVLDGLDRIFSNGPLAQIGKIGASDLTITLEDARVDRLWQVTGGRMLLTNDPERIGIVVNFDVFNGTEDLASTSMTFRSEKGSPAAQISARIRNARSGDIALQSPVLAFLGVLDAPLSGAIDVDIGADGRLSTFSGALTIGAGAVTPGPGWTPIRLDSGALRFTYDPAQQRIDFAELSASGEAGSVRASGQTFMEDLRPDGWPRVLVGQFRMPQARVEKGLFVPAPVNLTDGVADVKLSLDPFRLTLGALTLKDGDSTLRASGVARSGPQGPDVSFDLALDHMRRDRLFQIWPEQLIPKTRAWLEANIPAGSVRDVHFGLRRVGDGVPRRMLGLRFEDATVRFLPKMPPITGAKGYVSLDDNRLVVVSQKGTITAPEGGAVDVTGTTFSVNDVRPSPEPTTAQVHVAARGPVTAVLSLLNQPPINAMERAGKPVDLASGSADLAGSFDFPLAEKLDLKELHWDIGGNLSDVASDKLMDGRRVTAAALKVHSTEKEIEISGPARLGVLPVDVTWTQPLGAGEAAEGRLDGTVEMSQAFLDEFGIALPRGSVWGQGTGRIEMALSGEAPSFTLTSDLQGVGMRIDSVVWSKSPKAKGRLEVAGVLGAHPAIDRIEIEGGGLTATGAISLKPDGALDKATFSRVQLGGWLDAPVTLVGRGSAQPAVQVNGGTLDFRKASFGDAGGTGGGPLTARLDRLYVADGITLTAFQGDFSTVGGFGGSFRARLNGGGTVNGTVVPQKNGSALKVVSDDAGKVLKDAGLADRVRGGAMEMTLVPTAQEGVYSGHLSAQRVRVRGTPALAALLDAISVVGLLQQLNGDGIVFEKVQSDFLLTPKAVNFRKASAVGASMGISVEGMYELGSARLDLRGVVSPFYMVNGIGSILTRKGEGLFGFNYRVRGTVDDPKVSVNPLSILTPGMFREIFRGKPPEVK